MSLGCKHFTSRVGCCTFRLKHDKAKAKSAKLQEFNLKVQSYNPVRAESLSIIRRNCSNGIANL